MNRPSYIVELDVLRAIAILMVLVHHLPAPAFGALHLKGGNYGVDLFFVLSGFLITRIRLREMSDGIGLKNFWIRRVGRIVPASALCLLVVCSNLGAGLSRLACSNIFESIRCCSRARRARYPHRAFLDPGSRRTLLLGMADGVAECPQ